MRVDSNHQQPKQSTRYAPLPKRRQQEKGSHRDQNDSDSIDLSDEAKLLNQLLLDPENEFIPFPFYFANAPARNIKQACTIAHRIQRKAESFGIKLSYTMIYDMVVNHAMHLHNNNIYWSYDRPNLKPLTNGLTEEEKELFEQMHNACLQKQISVEVIKATVVSYIDIKERSDTAQLPITAKESAQAIVSIFKKSPELLKGGIAQDLSTIIQKFVKSKSVDE